MKEKLSPIQKAASFLGRSRSAKKVAAARVNGRLGGRRASGVCPERLLRRRVHAYATAHRVPLSPLLSWAVTVRASVLAKDVPLSAVSALAVTPDQKAVALLIPVVPSLF